jgi:hypothetical protein
MTFAVAPDLRLATAAKKSGSRLPACHANAIHRQEATKSAIALARIAIARLVSCLRIRSTLFRIMR